MFQLIVSNF